MPAGRSWIVTDSDTRRWEIKTAREGEVYHRPLDGNGAARGGWRPGLPPISDVKVLPESLREVLDIFAASGHTPEDPC